MESSLKFSLFVAILAVLPSPRLAWSIPFTFGFCQTPPYVTNLNATRFFSGTWYQQKSYGEFLVGEGQCPTKKVNVSSGSVSELFYDYEEESQSWVTLTGTGTVPSNGVGVLDITYALAGFLTYTAPVTIVETDYDSYALCYSCKQSLFVKTEMAWAMTRERTGNTSVDFTSIISYAGLDASSFKDANNTDCPSNEPSFL